MFERFASEVNKDYGVPIKDDADDEPGRATGPECVANLYPDAFARLEEFCHRNQHFVEPTIVRFDREIRFYSCTWRLWSASPPPG